MSRFLKDELRDLGWGFATFLVGAMLIVGSLLVFWAIRWPYELIGIIAFCALCIIGGRVLMWWANR